MNEEQSALPLADPPALDPALPAPEETGTVPGPGDEGIPAETPAEAPDPLGGDPAPDPPADLPDPQELGRLREELTRLCDEVRSAQEALLRREAELAEFRELFPGVPVSSLPDAVWDDVRRGVPLSAAFALSERRREHMEKTAADVNRSNRDRSCGAAGGQTSGFLSAREVRAMTPAEVREHYNQIMLSMPKWQ